MEKKTIYLLATIVIIVIGITMLSPPESNNIVQPQNQTVIQQPVIYDMSKVNWLPWIGMGMMAVWIVWREKFKGAGKPYVDWEEATEDLKKKAKDSGMFPIVIEQFDFTDPKTKLEATGSFRCTNEQSPYKFNSIPFKITKSGRFAYDLTRIFSKPMKEKDMIEIKTKKKEEKKA